MKTSENLFGRVIYSFFIIVFIVHLSLALEYNKQHQRYNPNSDFLLHESGVNQNSSKTDYAASQTFNRPTGTLQNSHQTSGKRDYVAFPPLSSGTTVQTTGKPSLSVSTVAMGNNQQSSGKRDYVAQFPPLKPLTGSTSHITQNPNLSISTGSHNPPKRDYVVPQYPSLKPTQGNTAQSTGKVKDLINFYDNKANEQNVPQKVPSYSSILQGNNKQNAASVTPSTTGYTRPVTSSTQKFSTSHTTKPEPLSFSSVVAGFNKPSSPTSLTTPIPSTKGPVSTPTKPGLPGSPVLPSSIINNNRNNNKVTTSNSNGPSDSELQTLSEELLRKDVNNAAKYITINYQEKTTSQSKEDKAALPLLTISPEVWNIPTVQKFVTLLDNYDRDTLVNEYVTPQERNEENAFMDAIMSTTVIRHLMNFLKDKGYVTPDPRQQRDFLKQLWFTLYSRGKGKIGSSGFEHVFVSELKNGEVSGLHNWVYFSKEEAMNRVNYLGYLKYVQLNDKGVVMKLHFNQQGVDKPVDSMFIGTSPELEIALYTLCFVTRADNDCKLKLGSKDVDMVTHTFRYRSKNLIGSAYPQI